MSRSALFVVVSLLQVALLVLTACSASSPAISVEGAATGIAAESADPPAPVELTGDQRLHIVATTNIVADVISVIGGEHIELTALLPIGADPHSYTATPQDLRLLNDAHAIIMNGLSLEESLQDTLENLDNELTVVELAGDPERLLDGHGEEDEHGHGEEDEHGHGDIDPHTWMDVAHVVAWSDKIAEALSALDPAHAAAYAANASRYKDELAALDAEIRQAAQSLDPAQRKMVTDHDVFAYYAAAYGYDIVGTVIDSLSTIAAPSARDLAALQDQMVHEGIDVLFVGTTVNPQLAQQLAADLSIAVVPLYTGSLSKTDGPAATYQDYMRYNTNAIVNALSN